MTKEYSNEIKEQDIIQNVDNSKEVLNINGSGQIYGGNLKGQQQFGGLTTHITQDMDIQNEINKLRDLGGGILILGNGIYYPTSDILLYSNVYLQGQNKLSTIIDFNSQAYGIVAIGTDAYSTGTLSVNAGSTTVTGAGTVWTSAMTGKGILISGIWYTIAYVNEGTQEITISLPFVDSSISGASYIIADYLYDISIKDLTIKNSTTSAVEFRYTNEVILYRITFINCATGYDIKDSSNTEYDNIDSIYCGTGGAFNNNHYSLFKSCGDVKSTTKGIDFNLCSNIAFNNNFILGSTGNGITITSCSVIIINGSTSKGNGGKGIELVSGNDKIQVISNNISNNTSDGIKLTATSDDCQILNNQLISNGGYGWNIANSNCDRNLIGINKFYGNSSGMFNDSGTGTINSEPAGTFVPGDVLFLSADTGNIDGGTGSYAKTKQFTVKRGGTYRIKVTAYTDDITTPGSYRIYKNGVAYGDIQNLTTSGTTYSQDISGFAPNDTIELWIKSAVGKTITSSNFRLYVSGIDSGTVDID